MPRSAQGAPIPAALAAIRTVGASQGHLGRRASPFSARAAQQTCGCILGRYFLSMLYYAIGQAALSAAMRELYGLYLAYEYYPSEEQVYRVSSSMCRTTYQAHCPMRISGFTAAPSSGSGLPAAPAREDPAGASHLARPCEEVAGRPSAH